MKTNFHILDGIKIGGIENLAFTLSSEKIDGEENYLINLSKFPKNMSLIFTVVHLDISDYEDDVVPVGWIRN